jgi:hypothetical protein
MSHKNKNPEQRGRADRVRYSISSAAINPEDNPVSLDFQLARAISRRFSLPPTVAALVAQLAFGEAASCR